MFRRRLLKKAFGCLSQFQYITKNGKAKILFWAKKIEDRISQQIARETNLILAARKARATPQKQWRFLQIAAEKTAEISESLILVWLFNEARTFFEENI